MEANGNEQNKQNELKCHARKSYSRRQLLRN